MIQCDLVSSEYREVSSDELAEIYRYYRFTETTIREDLEFLAGDGTRDIIRPTLDGKLYIRRSGDHYMIRKAARAY